MAPRRGLRPSAPGVPDDMAETHFAPNRITTDDAAIATLPASDPTGTSTDATALAIKCRIGRSWVFVTAPGRVAGGPFADDPLPVRGQAAPPVSASVPGGVS